MPHIVALDIGTSSMRAVLYDSTGVLLHACGFEYHTTFPQPSYVEQNPESWLEAAVTVLRRMSEYLEGKEIAVEAISVTSQRASLIPMDRDGRPLRDAIMWQDKRSLPVCEALEREMGLSALHRKTGLRLNPFFVLNKIIWLRDHEPDIYMAADKFIGVQDYVTYQLTGQYVTDWTQASRTMLMNIETFSWDRELLEMAGITTDHLCELVAPGSIAGRLRADVAAFTGMPAGIPVILSGGDQQNAALALGVIKPGQAEANTGTGSFVIGYADRPVFDADCRVLCQASAIAGNWVAEASIFNTGSIYRWFREQFRPDLADDPKPFVKMDSEASEVPPGSNGVMMLPHFEGSAAPYWNPRAKGIFFNLSLGTTHAAMQRAILEGIALEIADNLDLIESLTGRLSEVSVAGGMVKSDLFCRIQADAYGRRVIRYRNNEASSLGAAMNGFVSLGVYPSIPDAFAAMVQGEAGAFIPDAVRREQYLALLHRKNVLYTALHEGGAYHAFMDL